MIQHEGPGWRLAWDSSRKLFPYLIGGENWAFELSEKEWHALAAIICDLTDQHRVLQSQLMPEESISVELERLPWWACIDGLKDKWSLKLILLGDDHSSRSLEMYWPIPIGQVVTSLIRKMWDSSQ